MYQWCKYMTPKERAEKLLDFFILKYANHFMPWVWFWFFALKVWEASLTWMLYVKKPQICFRKCWRTAESNRVSEGGSVVCLVKATLCFLMSYVIKMFSIWIKSNRNPFYIKIRYILYLKNMQYWPILCLYAPGCSVFLHHWSENIFIRLTECCFQSICCWLDNDFWTDVAWLR